MKLTFDEILFLRDIARMEIYNAQDDLHRWEACEPTGNITEIDIVLSVKYHKNRIKTAMGCVEKLTEMMQES